MVIKEITKPQTKEFSVDLSGVGADSFSHLKRYGAFSDIIIRDVNNLGDNKYSLNVEVKSKYNIKFTNNIKFNKNKFRIEDKSYTVYAHNKNSVISLVLYCENTKSSYSIPTNISTDEVRRGVMLVLSKNSTMWVPYNLDSFIQKLSEAFKIARVKAQV